MIRKAIGHGLLALSIGLLGSAVVQAQGNSDKETNPNRIVHRINPGHPTTDAPTAGSKLSLSPLTRHGGPVMTGSVNVHLIWYGNWNQANGSDTPAGQAIVQDFMAGISLPNTYLPIANSVTGALNANGTIASVHEGTDAYSRGKRLKDSDIASIVSNYVGTGGVDSNAVYFVLTSSDVAETSGFCNRYCGWHTKGTVKGALAKYSFVGNANRCLSGCSAQTIGPNGNAGVDGMLSVIAHELEEAVTDPELNAWYDSSGAENADKCAWTFGSALTLLPSGAYYNMTLPGKSGASRNFLIQRNLDAFDNKCWIAFRTQQ